MATVIMSRNTRPNPYVGPRAFLPNEKLYGRDTETRKLANVLGAERIVLLHSPSGAGKTSLIQAALIPYMQKRKFHVRPVARVNRDLSGSAGETFALPGYNRYIFSLLSSLEDDQLQDTRKPDKELAGLTLTAYLEQRPKPANIKFELFIFDQFEEILTMNPADQTAKHDFFTCVGAMLHDPTRWALFAMREDFVAALAPYLIPISNRLSVTFRLDLLGADAACQAIKKPVQDLKVGVEFVDAAAQTLVDDLRRVRVQRPDGSFEAQTGPHVEPVQLQVICYRLWESLTPDDDLIDLDDLATLGDVGHALAEYYAERVTAIAIKSAVPERTIREWFDHKLMTDQGIRTPVLMGIANSEGLSNSAVHLLENAHLVRAEKRGGATWYELAHDRLVEPIRTNNAAWFEANLSLLQSRATDWEDQKRPKYLLLRGDALKTAAIWVAANINELNQTECDFWNACQEAKRQTQRERRTNQVIRILAIVSAVITCFAVYFFCQARKQTEQVKQILFTQKLLSKAEQQHDELGALLARQAYEFQKEYDLPLLTDVDRSLRKVLLPPYFAHTLYGHTEAVRSVAFSPDGRFLASGSWDKRILLWDLEQPAEKPQEVGTLNEGIRSIVFSPNGNTLISGSDEGIALWYLNTASPLVISDQADIALTVATNRDKKWIAAGMADGTVKLWNYKDEQLIPLPLNNPQYEGDKNDIWSIAFSSDGQWLASGSENLTIRLWNLSSSKIHELTGHVAPIRSLAFTPDNRYLASGSDDATIRLWNVEASPVGTETILEEHTNKILALAFNPDGTQLGTSSLDGTVRLWDMTSQPAKAILLPGYQGITHSIAFSPKNGYMALGMADNTVQVWETQTNKGLPRLVTGNKAPTYTTAFARHGNWLVSGGGTGLDGDYMVRLWNLAQPDQPVHMLYGHTAPVHALALNPTGNLLVSGSSDHTLRLWNLWEPAQPLQIWKSEFEDQFYAVSFSPNGKVLAAANDYGNILLWDLAHLEGKPTKVFTDHTDRIFALAFNQDGTLLASAGEDRTILLWDVEKEEPIPRILVDDAMPTISSIAFHPNENLLATGGSDGKIRVWNINSRKVVQEFSGHASAVLSIAYSSNGLFLISGSTDHTALIWESDDQQAPLQIIPTETGAVVFVDFAPKDKTVTIGVDDGRLFLWPVATNLLAESVCHKVWRQLRQKEWEQFIGEDFPYAPICP